MWRKIPVTDTQIIDLAEASTEGYNPTQCIDCLDQEETDTAAVAARKVSYANGCYTLTGVCENHRNETSHP